MDVTPNSYKWISHFSKSFNIKNTGSTTWKIDAWYYGVGYEIYDPSSCMGKTLSSGGSCTMYIHGMPMSAPSTFRVEGSVGGVVVASDTSYLN